MKKPYKTTSNKKKRLKRKPAIICYETPWFRTYQSLQQWEKDNKDSIVKIKFTGKEKIGSFNT